MSRLTEAEAKEQIEAIKGFEFWNPECYEDCIKDEYGLSYIGETTGCKWLVSVLDDDTCLITIHGRNYRFLSQNNGNSFLISHFTDILLLAIEEA